MSAPRVLVVGAGVGGLSAAVSLAAQGVQVTVLERADHPGGKLRRIDDIDLGPTVFTMRWVFDQLFAAAGTSLEAQLQVSPLSVLARHAWPTGETLDLFADVQRSADAIGVFAGAAEARGFLRFVARSAEIHRTLSAPWIRSERPSVLELTRRVGLANLGALRRTMPFSTLWGALGDYFEDVRLRQLFARYATYVGSSPLEAPATLMLVSHVEQQGVWRLEGGMQQLAHALQRVGASKGATYRFSTHVRQLLLERGRVVGVELESGEALHADAVVFNGDVAALASGLLGPEARSVAPVVPPRRRSLSAITFGLRARPRGISLSHHNVFFAEHYPEEFDALFRRRELPAAPTVYLCAQDRGEPSSPPPDGPERLLCLVNAPADGDSLEWTPAQVATVRARADAVLRRGGLELDETRSTLTTPTTFHHLFPGSGGALYGQANHGAMGSFERLGAVSALPGLFLAGGTVHPGPGIPMAALSGQLCAARVLADEFGRRPRAGPAITLPALV